MDKDVVKTEEKMEKKDNTGQKILYACLMDVLLAAALIITAVAVPEELPVLVSIGIAMIASMYVTVTCTMKFVSDKEKEREEQYNSILKSEKASYLLIRKYCDDIEERLAVIMDQTDNPMQEVVTAQKALAKVTISRNKENADAIMNSNDKLLDLAFGLENKLEEVHKQLACEQDKAIKELTHQMLQKQQEIASSIRETELVLKNEILTMATRVSSVQQPVVMAAPQMSMPMAQTPVAPMPISEPEVPEFTMPDLPEVDELSMPQEELVEEMELASMDIDAMNFDEPVESEPEEVAEPSSEPAFKSIFDDDDEKPASGLFDDDEPAMTMEELDAMLEDIDMAGEVLESEPVVEEPVVEEVPPMPDLSDPNKMMSADDIAALIANMGSGDAEPEPEPEPEVIPVVEEEKPPMPDLSDPNKMMSADDIAALIANMGGGDAEPSSEPEEIPVEEEEVPPMPDLSDPNKMMSADDIAALIANMGGGDAEPEPVEIPVEEEKPPMPDLSDPNRAMSADEIAALFANMT